MNKNIYRDRLDHLTSSKNVKNNNRVIFVESDLDVARDSGSNIALLRIIMRNFLH